MGQQSKDVESLQESGRRRGSCLDIFLVVSVVFLFVTLTALTVVGLMVVMELRSELKTLRVSNPREFETPSLPPSKLQADKMQNYAYLEATPGELRNSTMSWLEFEQGNWKSVGNNVDFDKKQHSLKLKQKGTYFMFIDLNVTCKAICNAGLLRVHVGDKLTCELELPATLEKPQNVTSVSRKTSESRKTSVSSKCWTVSWLSDEKLLAQMTVSEGQLNDWFLEGTGSGFGVFLVN
ncbi:uncharacterized protein LOC127533406 isoform X2 [Acanthochromis polyacanthus]|uniref:uncharacterized protein LOC127533406 isoform X2 n=1 Tax=Acanthochromis polyacanthus TaxID=80966 RepID=UPI0022342B54|nr:uncharacterized protein LOC127533406 isoform X2 [Acanthochromis polyacanthus]